ncbi:MAG: hypothetical protein HYX53_00350 [Chloroflexi bacterium]|nr:hypothetical protein [Chloroflexota bacterium]
MRDWYPWEELPAVEAEVALALEGEFSVYEVAVSKLYGVIDDVLSLDAAGDAVNVRVAAVCLNRALNDLRSAWLLARHGYIAQAATLMTSCWEHATASEVVSGSPDVAEAFVGRKPQDSGWGPKALAKKARDRRVELVPELVELSPEYFERIWANNYAAYCWLCQLKHPTADSLLHEAATKTTSAHQLTITARPDGSPEYAGLRALVLQTGLNAIYSAVGGFLAAVRNSVAPDEFERVANSWVLAHNLITSAVRIEDIPISLAGSAFAEDFKRFRANARMDGPDEQADPSDQ